MRVVNRLQIPLGDYTFTVNLPKDSKILKIGNIANVPYLWYEADISKEVEPKIFYLYKTGDQIADEKLYHVGTFILVIGNFDGINVLHVYTKEILELGGDV